jgi:hypothetical protein
MDKLNLDIKSLKKFGLTMSIAFLVIAGIFYLRYKYNGLTLSLAVSGLFLLAEVVSPVLLKPVYIVWMRFAFILSWVNTRLLLIIIFYLIFTPFGLLMRLFRVDLLQTKDKKDTYWYKKEKTVFNPADYERRF